MKRTEYRRVPGSDSTLLKVMSILPNRYRPLVIAFELYAAWRNRQRLNEAKQTWVAEHEHELTRAQERRAHRRHGPGLGTLILGAAATWGVSQLMKTQNKGEIKREPRVRSTGLMPERETTTTTSETTSR